MNRSISAFNIGFAALLFVGAAVIIGCGSSSGHDQNATRDSLIDREKQSWQAWKDHDAMFFQNFLANDHVEILSNGPVDKDAVVRTVGGKVCTVENYSVDRFTVTLIGKDAAVVTYHAAQTTTCNGAAVPSPVWATSVYAKRDDRWLNVYYVQTTAAK